MQCQTHSNVISQKPFEVALKVAQYFHTATVQDWSDLKGVILLSQDVRMISIA